MADTARQFFDSLSNFRGIQDLIDNAESEGLLLECKAPSEPRLSKDQRVYLAKALSGFPNTAGGVILWGVSTTKHAQTGLDVLTQIEPIGSCAMFARHIQQAVITLTTPPQLSVESRILKKRAADTRGVVATYIPRSEGDPVQANLDHLFYFRAGDQFVPAPHEMIKRLFAATQSPDLHVVFDDRLVLLKEDGRWEIPIIIRNESSAIAQDVRLVVKVDNPDACQTIEAHALRNASDVNPGESVFVKNVGAVYRGLNSVEGNLIVKMQVGRRARRVLQITASLYANNMRARNQSVTIWLAKKGFSVRSSRQTYLY